MAQSDESALLVRMEASLAKFEKQMQAGVMAAEKSANMIEGRFGSMGKRMSKSAEASASAMVKEMDALRAKYDPIFAASKRYEDELGQIDRAWKVGAITAAQHGAAIERLNTQYAAVQNAANDLGDAALRGGDKMRMAAMQLSQVGQQTMATGNFVQALAIQLPDLGLAFGTVGAAAGLLAGIALPALWSAFTGTTEEAQVFADQLDKLGAAIGAYVEAVKNANMSQDELKAKYGAMAAEAQKALAMISEAAKASALLEFKATIDAAAASLLNLQMIGNRGGTMVVLADDFGMTTVQADALREALINLDQQTTLQGTSSAAMEVNRQLLAAFGTVERMPPALQTVFADMAALVDKASEFNGAVQNATFSVDNLAAIASSLSGYFGAADGAAGGLAKTLARAAEKAWSIAQAAAKISASASATANGGGTLPKPGTIDINQDPGGVGTIIIPKSSGGGGGGGGGKGGGQAQESIFKTTEADIQRLEREIELLGRSAGEVAKLKAEWAILDAAKKQGLDLDKVQAGSSRTLREEISAQAQAVADLTMALDHQKDTQARFEKGIDGITDALAKAGLAGESLREGLGNVFRSIAMDFAKSGIKDILMSLAGGGKNGGGFLSGLLGGMFGGAPSFDGGGLTGNGARAGGVDGKGGFPAILHPREAVVDIAKGQSTGGGVIELRVASDPSVIVEISRNETGRQVKAAMSQVPSIVANHNKRKD